MTTKEAYAEGFCKAAEALGVSPQRLSRRMLVKAAAPAWLGRLAGRGWKGMRRFGQLMSGSRYDRINAHATDAMNRLSGARESVSRIRSELGRVNSARWRELNNMRGGAAPGAAERLNALTARSEDAARRLSHANDMVARTKATYNTAAQMRNREFWKVMGTRGAVLGGGAGIYGAMGGFSRSPDAAAAEPEVAYDPYEDEDEV